MAQLNQGITSSQSRKSLADFPTEIIERIIRCLYRDKDETYIAEYCSSGPISLEDNNVNDLIRFSSTCHRILNIVNDMIRLRTKNALMKKDYFGRKLLRLGTVEIQTDSKMHDFLFEPYSRFSSPDKIIDHLNMIAEEDVNHNTRDLHRLLCNKHRLVTVVRLKLDMVPDRANLDWHVENFTSVRNAFKRTFDNIKILVVEALHYHRFDILAPNTGRCFKELFQNLALFKLENSERPYEFEIPRREISILPTFDVTCLAVDDVFQLLCLRNFSPKILAISVMHSLALSFEVLRMYLWVKRNSIKLLVFYGVHPRDDRGNLKSCKEYITLIGLVEKILVFEPLSNLRVVLVDYPVRTHWQIINPDFESSHAGAMEYLRARYQDRFTHFKEDYHYGDYSLPLYAKFMFQL